MSATRRQFLAAAAAAPLAGRAVSLAAPPPDGAGFATDLFGRLRTTPGNVFVSPFSVRVALAMTAAGAKGDTLAEFERVLRLPADPAAADASLGKQLAAVNASGKRGVELRTANALWAAAGYPFRPEFLARAKSVYGAGAEECDFAARPEPSRVRINDWVAKETNGKIKDLLAPGVVTRGTRLVLTNAVYFKGLWAVPFKKELTKDARFFHDAETRDVKLVPLMHRYGGFSAADDTALPYQAAELLYQGGEVSMLVVVPRDPAGLPAVEAQFTPDWLKQVRASLRPADDGELFLPRFKIEAQYELNDPLKAMGLKLAFDGGDFSGMSSAERLVVSAVVHKAFVEVNEAGTEAAAATAVVMATTSMPAPRKPVVVRADRPFLFVLRHAPTDTVLFAGRYARP